MHCSVGFWCQILQPGSAELAALPCALGRRLPLTPQRQVAAATGAAGAVAAATGAAGTAAAVAVVGFLKMRSADIAAGGERAVGKTPTNLVLSLQ